MIVHATRRRSNPNDIAVYSPRCAPAQLKENAELAKASSVFCVCSRRLTRESNAGLLGRGGRALRAAAHSSSAPRTTASETLAKLADRRDRSGVERHQLWNERAGFPTAGAPTIDLAVGYCAVVRLASCGDRGNAAAEARHRCGNVSLGNRSIA